MALFGKEVAREFIAVPDDKKGQILYKWPDKNIRKFTRAIVAPDELAVFVNRGEVVGTLPPGHHVIDADEWPFLGKIIDAATEGRAYRAELYFVGTREYTGNRFGGRIDDVQDPQTGLIVTLRVFGEYALRVIDPAKLILHLTGTVDVTDNSRITQWTSEQLLKVMRTTITRAIVANGWPILGLSARTQEVEGVVMPEAGNYLADYGLGIARMGNFDINLAEEDQDRLKTLAKDTAYSRLAGSFNQYAAGEALLGAGEGMARGGGEGTGAAFIGLGLGLGQQAMQSPAQAAPPPPAAPGFAGGGQGYTAQAGAAGGLHCTQCGTAVPSGARFCASCGTPVASGPAHCTQCGTELAAGARFCPGCGTAVAGAAPAPQPAPPPPPPAAAPPHGSSLPPPPPPPPPA